MAQYGGQAVLEGVMMRGPSVWSVAVRKPDGEIAEHHQGIDSPMRRHWFFRLPVVRGVVALGESLAIGFRALSISANYALGDVAEVRARDVDKARKQVEKLLEAGEPVRVRVKRGGVEELDGLARDLGSVATVEQAPAEIGGATTMLLAPVANGAAVEAAEPSDPAEIGRWTLVVSFVIAIGFVVGVFKVGPALITDTLPIKSGVWFVLTEGGIRLTLFLAYLTGISFLPSLKRVFQYHAAEHKAINAYEAGDPLEPEVVQRHSLIHPRCGTAFLLWVMVIAIFVFAFFGRLPWYWLIVSRIALLPVIAGLAYELIRFAGRHSDKRWLMTLLAPGLWLQRLTTREPDLTQIAVSIRALETVLHLERDAPEGSRRVEVMA
ncbi:MAG: hypothetical protein QOH73_909 [Gaiellaceae bacterium]|jgi:uncharacterized protein YqhQ|nr:hypothetical protein [Gaiellaceae bacterium]